MNAVPDIANTLLTQTNEQIEALDAEKRNALVKDLAEYMAAHPHRPAWKAIHTVSPLVAAKSVVTASYPTAQLMFGNDAQFIDYALYGWFATGIATIDIVHKKTASPVAKLLHDAVTLAGKLEKEKPLPHRYDLEGIKPEDMPEEMKRDKLARDAAEYIQSDPAKLEREQIQRKYGTVITGLALLASVLAASDLAHNEELRGPNDRSENEKHAHRILDIAALAGLGIGAVGYKSLRRKLFGNSPTEELIEDAQKLNEKLKAEGGKTAHYFSGLKNTSEDPDINWTR